MMTDAALGPRLPTIRSALAVLSVFQRIPSRLPRMESTLSFYHFTRRMIQRNELGPFMRLYDPASLEPWRHLPALFGRMCFSFDCFEDNWSFDPNVRRFWRVLHECCLVLRSRPARFAVYDFGLFTKFSCHHG
jgi:hypothetical protein